jgi:hypothetical protein
VLAAVAHEAALDVDRAFECLGRSVERNEEAVTGGVDDLA